LSDCVQPPDYTFDEKRLAALDASDILDTPSEPGFDDIVQLAAQICQTPVSLVSFVWPQYQHRRNSRVEFAGRRSPGAANAARIFVRLPAGQSPLNAEFIGEISVEIAPKLLLERNCDQPARGQRVEQSLAIPSRKRGVGHRHERWGGKRWTRAASSRKAYAGRSFETRERSAGAETNGADADGKTVWSWHPLLVSSWWRFTKSNRVLMCC
jgi:hypothetical protein